MKTPFLATLILTLSTSAGFAQQPAQCRNFEATIALQMTKEGCLSQIDLCTVGTVMSNEPALSGAMWFFTGTEWPKRQDCLRCPKHCNLTWGRWWSRQKAEHSRPPVLASTTPSRRHSANWIRSSREPIDSATTPPAGSFFSPASVAKAADLIRERAANCA